MTPINPPSSPSVRSNPDRQDLGLLVSTYKGRQFKWSDVFILFLPGIVAGVILLVIGNRVADSGYAKFGPAVARFWSQPWFLAAALVFFICLLLIFYRTLTSLMFVAVHREGLRFRLSGFFIHQYRWTEIAGIALQTSQDFFFRWPLRRRYFVVLYPNLGNQVILPEGLQSLPELVSQIKASLYARLLPEMRKDFQASHWIYFGPVAIHQEGIRFTKPHGIARTGVNKTVNQQNPKIKWADITSINIQSGFLVIEFQNKKSKKYPTSQIPNLEIMLILVREEITL